MRAYIHACIHVNTLITLHCIASPIHCIFTVHAQYIMVHEVTFYTTHYNTYILYMYIEREKERERERETERERESQREEPQAGI